MNIYFSGIGGVGVGPLAEIARDAGHTVVGSDKSQSLVTQELEEQQVLISFNQNGSFLKEQHENTPFDWFVYTAALPENHPELLLAKELGIRTGKRDEFLANFISEHNLKLIAISGTHGKTTTTGMAVWALKQLDIPVSYSIGTTVSFGSSGAYDPDSEYFVYECDEFDKNFLHFTPHLSLITSVDYDHPDTYPTEKDYTDAFQTFIANSARTIAWSNDLAYLKQVTNETIWSLGSEEVTSLELPGEHNRRNATLVIKALEYLSIGTPDERLAALSSFPGTDRRFEKLASNIYSDYGHHPVEIAATLQLARELSDNVVLVYQPHQNVRQHEIREQYIDQFEKARDIYWLPTYLSREDPKLAILEPKDLIHNITNSNAVHIADFNDELWSAVQAHRDAGHLVLFMGAGAIDGWVRQQLAN